MNEQFIHHLWQFQRFAGNNLQTTAGDTLKVFSIGHPNENAGPDFSNAKIKIGDMDWVGNVEIHIRSSDWYVHRHQTDKGYDSVILHVVWEDNQDVIRTDGSMIPTLELKPLIEPNLIASYRSLVNSPTEIPCASQIGHVDDTKVAMMVSKLVTERLEQKASEVSEIFQKVNKDWEETSYRVLARAFGLKLNSDPFDRLVSHLPLKVIRKHADHPHQVYGLILGQAGFLEETTDEYSETLQREYQFLVAKYKLETPLHRFQWKFSKLRPPSFPTIRLVQFATLMSQQQHFFHQLIAAHTFNEVQRLLTNPTTEKYWLEHYDFGKPYKSGKSSKIGQGFVLTLIANAIAPLLMAYSKEIGNIEMAERAVLWLEQLPLEKNKITSKWQKTNISIENAFDTQGLNQLYKHYCMRKRCLQCAIGVDLLR
ncbi:MAG: DUF2851 family protein [Cyclobacteriaceae bacterium]|nr:DUF2851 family protein [Cyclobacteriaceae bacterium HetDA_MAG_MS6]